MNELKLSDNLNAHLKVFEEKLRGLRLVGTLEDEARVKSEQEAAIKHPLAEEDKSLI